MKTDHKKWTEALAEMNRAEKKCDEICSKIFFVGRKVHITKGRSDFVGEVTRKGYGMTIFVMNPNTGIERRFEANDTMSVQPFVVQP